MTDLTGSTAKRSSMLALVDRAIGLLDRVPYWLMALPLRAAVATVFWNSAMAKLANWDTTIELFTDEYKVPLLTISGLAKITESGNPYIFRFLPNDREIKVAHARYVVEVMKKTKIALISDTTAYGQGGFALLQEDFAKLGTKPVFEDNSIAPDTKDMSPLLARVKASGADVIVLHAVSTPMTLITKQIKSTGLNIPIVNSSSIVEPTATALFEPAELAARNQHAA